MARVNLDEEVSLREKFNVWLFWLTLTERLNLFPRYYYLHQERTQNPTGKEKDLQQQR